MNINLVDHPLIQHKVSLMRHHDINCRDFRLLVVEIGSMLTYEATRDLPLEEYEVQTWSGPTTGKRLKGKSVTVVPILRAGMGMLDGVLTMLPNAKVSVVGMYRNEQTLEPVSYYAKLASQIEKRTALIVDPMLATGGSLDAAISLIKQSGCQHIRALVLVAAPEGIERINENHPDVTIYTAAVDSHLNDKGYIIPGLGDAGDKIFGTV
tara:strand:- start:2226 stop:2852 length:627 start_codon:yes stop_codon:yes gene_type:complete